MDHAGGHVRPGRHQRPPRAALADAYAAPTFSGIHYVEGPWFWVNVVYSYALVVAGIAMLGAGLRRFPPPFRPRRVLVAAGAIAPVLANITFLAVLRPAGGPDITPLALSLSGLCFTWGLYRYRLFGLVPVARDMVVDNLDDGVLVLDAERRLIDLNASAERHTGVPAALVGRHIDDVVPWWSAADAERGDGPGMPIVVRVEPGDRVLEVRVSAVRDRARHFTGWLVVVRDITARRRAESERLALERRVQEKQRSDSLTVFAAGVAHDFNNLLTGILGNADLLAMQAPPDSAQRRTAEAIVVGAQRAADLVSDMLAYAGGTRGRRARRPRRAVRDGRGLHRVGVEAVHAVMPRRRTAAPGRGRPDADPPGGHESHRQRDRGRGRRRPGDGGDGSGTLDREALRA